MQETTQQTSLIPVDDIKALVTTAPAALEKNTSSVAKAKAAGQALLDRIKTEGMSPELDVEANNYLVRVRTTIANMEGARKPLTQFLTRITKEFTRLENELDRDNKESIPAAIQKARDEFAAECARRAKEAEAKAQAERNKAAELVNLKAEAERQLRKEFEFFLNTQVSKLQKAFNDITLDDFDSIESQIRAWSEVYPRDIFHEVEPQLHVIYNDKTCTQGIIYNARVELYDRYYSEFADVIMSSKQRLIDQLSGKKSTLEAQAAFEADQRKKAEEAEEARRKAADAKNESDRIAAEATAAKLAEEKRIADERAAAIAAEEARRKQEEEARLAQEAEERRKKEEADAELRKSADMANTLFDQAAQALPSQESTAQIISGYEIVVLAQAGWMLIFQLWFQNEGNKLSLEKFGKKTLDSMKGFCEKHALKTGEKISSPLLQYKETFKAAAVK